MKTYLLAALISSTVLSQQVLATTGTGEGPLRPPEVAAQPTPAPQYTPRQNAYANPEMMKKRAEHQKEMWAHQQKMRSVQNPEERRRLSDEHMNEMRQYMQEMRDMMRSSHNNHVPPHQNYGSYGRGQQYNAPYNQMPRQGHYNQGQQNRPMHMNKQQHFRNVEQRLARIEQMLSTLLQQHAQK